MPEEKICRGCKLPKPLTEYYSSPSSKGGYRSTCKKCCAIKRQTNHKISELVVLLAEANKKIEDNIYHKKYLEIMMRYDLLIQDIKDNGHWEKYRREE